MHPNCAKEWSTKFLREHFTNVFLTSKYKEHLENLLFEQEKALLPSTQPIVEEKIRKQNVKKQILDIDKLIENLAHEKRLLERSLYTDLTAERHQFVRQCPASGCRGFLSSQWKCGICQLWTCPDCHELKGETRDCPHTCDPNNVETAKLIAKDSKPCPKCQSMIFKIEGCDQMWCTQCHTAFSWKTGKFEKNIHNPHYYEWQRKNGGAPRIQGDIECGREITHNTCGQIQIAAQRHPSLAIKTYYYTYMYGNKDRYEYTEKIITLCDIVRNNIHNIHTELPNFQTNYVEKNLDLRVKYLENHINESYFKTTIQRNDKKFKKNNEVSQVIQLANTALTDIIYRAIDHLKKCEVDKYDLDVFINETSELVNYCNNIFKDIAFTYNSVQYGFNKSFGFIRVEKERKPRKKSDSIADEDDETSNNDTNLNLLNTVANAVNNLT